MKVILTENIPALGYKDDIVEVKDGYGRNYLIPQGMAIIASDAALKRLKEDQKQQAHKVAKIHEDAEAAAAAVNGVKLTIAGKAGGNGNVYGSVNAAHIAQALQELGHEVDRKLIELKDVIKQIGTYTATVRYLRDVSAEIEVEVVAEEEEK